MDTVKAAYATHQFLPDLMYNCDETMIHAKSKRTKVFTVKNGRRPIRIKVEKAFEHITIFICVSATGESLSPVAIFPRKTLPELDPEVESYFTIALQQNGWIDGAIFRNIIYTQFIPMVDRKRAELKKPNAPALLITDGHASRSAIDADMLVSKHNIYVLVIPSHSSTVFQPLDLSVNSEFKTELNRAPRLPTDSSADMKRRETMKVARKSLRKVLNPTTIENGWARSGLWPLNPDKPLQSHFVNDALAAQLAPKAPKRKRRSHLPNGNLMSNGEVFYVPQPIIEPQDEQLKIKIRRVYSSETNTTLFSIVKENEVALDNHNDDTDE